jgi:hypothetical protein
MPQHSRLDTLASVLLAALACALITSTALAQTTAFTYQGKLTDSSAPQSTYQMQFRLWSALVGGSQVGGQIDQPTVSVTDGVFTVLLDFGSSPFGGADRFLEIGVRRNAGENYTTLAPRQQLASSPYAIRTLSAQQADVALDANALGGVAANQYVTTASVGNAFVKNDTNPQTANYNITGNAQIGGLVGLGTPLNGNFRLDSFGSIRAQSNASAHFVAETTGGVNTWARTYWRSPVQSWFMGTSRDFNNNQLYVVDETYPPGVGRIRMMIEHNDGPILFPVGKVGIGTLTPDATLAVSSSTSTSGNNTAVLLAPAIGPNASHVHYGTTGDWYIRSAAAGGKVVLQDTGGNVGIGTTAPNAKLSVVGSVSQDLNSSGLPKAMLFLLANGTLDRCYNGMTGQSMSGGTTQSGCGFSVSASGGNFIVSFGVDVSSRYFTAAAFGGAVRKAINLRPGNNTTQVGGSVYDINAGTETVSDVFLVMF